MLDRALDARRGFEFAVSIGVTAVFALGAHRIGFEPALGLAILCLLFVAAVASPIAFAIGVLVLAPIPSTEALLGIRFPFGLDPLNLLVVIGLSVAALTGRPFPLRRHRALLAALCAYFAVFASAWWRSFGENATADTLSLLAKPLAAIAAAQLVVQLLPRGRERAIPLAMAGMLFAVAISIVLQRAGLYSTAQQETRGVELGAKQFGGLMLDGNSAGALFGIFAVPVYCFVAALGYRKTAFTVLFTAVPVLLITLSRSGMVGFVVGLVVAALADRRKLRGVRTLVGVSAFAAVWASTVGRQHVAQIADSIAQLSVDANAASSGRERIWTQVVAFLDGDSHRWLFGGGLDAFRTFALSSPLQHEFATHNLVLKLLTDGGVVLAAVAALVAVSAWRLGSFEDPIGRALRCALISFFAVGLTLDLDLLGRGAAWLWVLAALAATQRSTARAAATNRSAIGPTLHGLSGARIASRTSVDLT